MPFWRRRRSEAVTPRGVFSCVVDSDPRFHLEALRWYATLERVVGVDPADLVVHAVGGSETEVLRYLRGRGVSVVDVEAFDERSPHCNKISGALSMARADLDGVVVLTDTDIAMVQDARLIDLGAREVGFRPVGAGNPPIHVLENLFEAAGLKTPPRVRIEFAPTPGQRTLSGHGNGGLYALPGPLLPTLAVAWERWAHWVLDHRDLLETWSTFVDQVAMTLALAEGEVRPRPLGLEWNFPTNNPKRIPARPPEPAALHYKDNVTAAGLLGPSGSPVVDGRIALANEAIAHVWSEVFPRAREPDT
jgi:hypothetical protein